MNTAPFTMRSEVPSDTRAIEVITREAFANHPFSRQTEHLIVRSLRDAGALQVSLVAEVDRIVGHVAASPVTVDGQSLGWFGLGPVSVTPPFQRQGIGSALVRAALEQLQAAGAAGCVLLGSPQFYGRFGFLQNPRLVLPGAPAEHFMSLSWRSPCPSGEVSYHVAFNAVA